MSIDCRIDFDISNVRVYAGLQLNDTVRATVSWLPSIECAEKSREGLIDPGICDFMKFFEDGKAAYVTYYDHDGLQHRCTVASIRGLDGILEYERKVANHWKNKQKDIDAHFAKFGLTNGLCPGKYETFYVKLGEPLIHPTRVIFNNPATIVFWNDGTKTIVKCSEHDIFTKEGGFAAALAKKMYKTGGIKKILKDAVDQKEVTDGQ